MRKHYCEVSSTRRYATPAFGIGFMRKTIGIGKPIIGPKNELFGFEPEGARTTVSVSPWLSFVPLEYKDDCISIARIVLAKSMGIGFGKHERGAVLYRIVEDLHFEIWDRLLPLPKGTIGG